MGAGRGCRGGGAASWVQAHPGHLPLNATGKLCPLRHSTQGTQPGQPRPGTHVCVVAAADELATHEHARHRAPAGDLLQAGEQATGMGFG